MATVPLDARECMCGHHLDQDDTDAELTSEEIRLKAEELYENYLGARVEQAQKAVDKAQADFARDPSSQIKSDHVASAISELQITESDLSAQSARVAEMRKAILPMERPAVPKPVAIPSRKRVTALKAVATKPQARITRKPIPVLTEVVATTPTPQRPKQETKVASVQKHKAKVVEVTAAPVPPRSKQETEMSTVASRKSPAIRAMPAQQDIAPPLQSATPNPAFRQAQAAKAEKILRAKNTPLPTIVRPVKEEARRTPVTEPKPPQTTPVTTAKSAPRLYAPRDKKDCPNCTASVVITAPRCRCGYEFPSSEQLIPALTMSDEERAEFAKLFNIP